MKNKMMKYLTLFLLILITLTGCAELVDTKRKEVDVVITDVNYRCSYVTFHRIGKITTTTVHPSRYEITVKYKYASYTIDDSKIYNKYKEMKGKVIKAILVEYYYDDNSIKRDIKLY